MSHDVRYAVRTLVRARGFTLAAVLSLGLGIGGNVAIFSLLNAVVLKPLPYPDPERLVLINEVLPKFPGSSTTVYPVQGGHILRWRSASKSFTSVAGATGGAMTNLAAGNRSESLQSIQMTSNFFEVLGERPQLGRWFRRQEEQIGQPEVVILSDSLWHRRFSADRRIVGRKIVLDNKPYEVVGVTRPAMRIYKGQIQGWLPESPEVFLPLRLPPPEVELRSSGSAFWTVAVARLRPAVTLDQAHAEIEGYMAAFSRTNKERMEVHSLVRPLHQALAGDSRRGLTVLMGAVGFVLLIVCANLANLVLVRAARTRHELAVRSALGASTGHLVCQSLLESFLITLAGSALGVVAAWWIIALLVAHAPARLPRVETVSVDARVLLFSALLCVFTTLLFGLIPALRIARISPVGSLYSAGRWQTDSPGDNRLRAVFVAAEAGFATLLLIGAGLFLTSFENLLNTPRGFESQDIQTMQISLPPETYKSFEQRVSFFRRLESRLASLPTIRSVGYAAAIPLSGDLTSEGYISPIIKAGMQNKPFLELPMTSFLPVSSGYLTTLGIPLRAGRFFRDGESNRIALISETTAHRIWPAQSPIGQKFHSFLDSDGTHWFTVIGVVGDVRSTSLEHESLPQLYFPYWQTPWHDYGGESTLAVYVRSPVPNMIGAVRKEVRQIGSTVGVDDEGALMQFVTKSLSEGRFQAIVVAVFGMIALALAAIGVYGVASYSLAQRQKEIGIRVALGAAYSDIVTLLLRYGMVPVVAGAAAGLLAANFLSRVIANLLFEVRPLDPITFLAAPVILIFFAALASYIPARRGAHTDPAVALRYD